VLMPRTASGVEPGGTAGWVAWRAAVLVCVTVALVISVIGGSSGIR
jgi:hypothetical protein